ncbi:hypothetical protein GCM10010435_44050 [Winogradskya consettensis]|uniref:Helix-turn-helix domain-containing protein n=1 Tax=Winogradskya consettensis TaxID=113560 RepID=A0A919W688_9ACTN|nr:hypothetical protein [Actinoplanes consettensis]GIM82623.1 hypothetical protein Aco04nite_82440 [Actinoplanes consettensis]
MHDSEVTSSVIRDSAARFPKPDRVAYRVRDAAEQLGLSERQMWRLVSTRQIESYKTDPSSPSSSRRISHQALLDYVAAATKATKGEQLDKVA